ncbi:MAG TPA: helix-turn-helix transcriptional regulator [Chitinophagaceae bacterium]
MGKSKTNNNVLHNFLSTIGNNLYTLRIARKQSLKTVAKAVKMSSARLSKMEKGASPYCRIITLYRLSKYYNVKLKDIASGKKGKTQAS